MKTYYTNEEELMMNKISLRDYTSTHSQTLILSCYELYVEYTFLPVRLSRPAHILSLHT